MSTNFENRVREHKEKEKVRRQASEAQREKDLERDREKQRRHFLLEEQHVTRKLLQVSRCSRAKQQQRNVQRKCAARAKLLFC